MLNNAIILAGGSGRRVGGDIPKQFLEINGKTILEHCLQRFDAMPLIDSVTVVTHPDWHLATEELINHCSFQKIKHIVDGGKERYHSVLAGLSLYDATPCHVLIHDAVRPAVSERIIQEVIENLVAYRAVDVAIPATDTLIQVDPTHTFITDIPDRRYMYMVQTPQGFHSDTLRKAYRLALEDPDFLATDDCSVIRKYLPEEKIKIIRGEVSNLKFTYAGDKLLLEHLLKREKI